MIWSWIWNWPIPIQGHSQKRCKRIILWAAKWKNIKFTDLVPGNCHFDCSCICSVYLSWFSDSQKLQYSSSIWYFLGWAHPNVLFICNSCYWVRLTDPLCPSRLSSIKWGPINSNMNRYEEFLILHSQGGHLGAKVSWDD